MVGLATEPFRLAPDLEEEFTPNLETADPGDFAFEPVTEEEVREAIFNNSSNTAPEHSQISYKVLKCARYIVLLMQKCLEIGYHPKEWRKKP